VIRRPGQPERTGYLGNAIKIVGNSMIPKPLFWEITGEGLSFCRSDDHSMLDFAFPESMKKLKIFTSQDSNIALLGAASLLS
jgi:hypothetical protein